jgi:uncharacterized protein (DUF2132 family)
MNESSESLEPFESSEPDKKKMVSRDPLHGITLEMMIVRLVDRHGWQELGRQIPIRCFQIDPSVKSSLAFLRKTPWARKRVEDWYAYDARRKLMPPPE